MNKKSKSLLLVIVIFGLNTSLFAQIKKSNLDGSKTKDFIETYKDSKPVKRKSWTEKYKRNEKNKGFETTDFSKDTVSEKSIFRTYEDKVAIKKTRANAVQVNRRFEANNLANHSPNDNTMAVSNRGFIVSADNNNIDFYATCPDTLVQFQTYTTFYDTITLQKDPYDPRVIYDRYNNRFIFISLEGKPGIDLFSILHISFSTSEDPRGRWGHFTFDISSFGITDADLFFDYLHIGQNKSDAVITVNMVKPGYTDNLVFQFNKLTLYNGTSIPTAFLGAKIHQIVQTNNDLARDIVPLSDASQDTSYNKGIYLVNTQPTNDNKIYWYYLDNNVGNTINIVKNAVTLSGTYDKKDSMLQLASSDPLESPSCLIQHGFYMNDTLYTVHNSKVNGFNYINYNRIRVSNNTTIEDRWGSATSQLEYVIPCISHFGKDNRSLDVIIGFMRIGETIYPEMCAIHHDGNQFYGNSTIVKSSLDFIDYDQQSSDIEKFGDYITLQKKYNSNPPTCWMVGQFVANNPNHYNLTNLPSAYIAELGFNFNPLDSCNITPLGIFNIIKSNNNKITISPNPTKKKALIKSSADFNSLRITDVTGKVIEIINIKNNVKEFELNLDIKLFGLYYISIFNNNSIISNDKIYFDN